ETVPARRNRKSRGNLRSASKQRNGRHSVHHKSDHSKNGSAPDHYGILEKPAQHCTKKVHSQYFRWTAESPKAAGKHNSREKNRKRSPSAPHHELRART